MNHEEALAKAIKLLRLSKSSNANEAALAASKAQEIIDRYKFTEESLSLDPANPKPDEPIKDYWNDPIGGRGNVATWRWRLFLAIAQQNQCKGYLSNAGGIAIVGRPSDVATVRYIYAWLENQIEEITRKECAGNGRTYANNFRNGCVDTVRRKLQEQRKATVEAVKVEVMNNPLALIHINNAIARMEKRTEEVQTWMDEHLHLSKGRSCSSTYDPGAREHGRKAAEQIRIQPPKGTIKG